jgi:hypothetical protein
MDTEIVCAHMAVRVNQPRHAGFSVAVAEELKPRIDQGYVMADVGHTKRRIERGCLWLS